MALAKPAEISAKPDYSGGLCPPLFLQISSAKPDVKCGVQLEQTIIREKLYIAIIKVNIYNCKNKRGVLRTPLVVNV